MSETQNQIVLTPKLDSLPSILKDLNQWVNWNVGEAKDGGRYNKIPVNKNGRAINAHDPSNWLSLEEAYSNTQLLSITGGIAFDLSGDQIDLNEAGHLYLVGGDIDECVTSYQDGI
jgi:primase-polymerase (primpol)-like protein